MSTNPTSFTSGPTRQIQPGDTPDLNDGLLSGQVTGPQASSKTVDRGVASFLDDGEVVIGTQALSTAGATPFVPVETVTATGTASAAVVEGVSGITAPQRVAVTWRSETSNLSVAPGNYVKISSTNGQVSTWVTGTDNSGLKYARYLGIEAALLSRDSADPFSETLTPGIVPDQTVTKSAAGQLQVIWVQLIDTLTTDTTS